MGPQPTVQADGVPAGDGRGRGDPAAVPHRVAAQAAVHRRCVGHWGVAGWHWAVAGWHWAVAGWHWAVAAQAAVHRRCVRACHRERGRRACVRAAASLPSRPANASAAVPASFPNDARAHTNATEPTLQPRSPRLALFGIASPSRQGGTDRIGSCAVGLAGTSITTSQPNCVTWAGIHMKTHTSARHRLVARSAARPRPQAMQDSTVAVMVKSPGMA